MRPGYSIPSQSWFRRLPALLSLAGALLAAAPGTSHAASERVMIGMPDAIQPFSIPKENSGLIIDIVRAAFATHSVEAEFTYLPNARMSQAFAEGGFDAITYAKPGDGQLGVLSRWPMLTFRNQAITVRQQIPRLRSVAELGQYRVVTFQNARKFLGAEFAAMAAGNANYVELGHMPSRMLLQDRADVIVSQPDIFRYWLLHQATGDRIDRRVLRRIQYHDLFGKGNQYWFAFLTAQRRDEFENGLAAIYRNRQIDSIFERYARQYGTSREMFVESDCRLLRNNRPKGCGRTRNGQ